MYKSLDDCYEPLFCFGMMRPSVLMSRGIFASCVFRVRSLHRMCPVVATSAAYYSKRTNNTDVPEDIQPYKYRRSNRPLEELQDILEITFAQSRKIALKLRGVLVPDETLINVAVMLRENGFTGKKYRSKLFDLPIMELEQKLAYMKEAGVKAEYEYITQFENLFSKSILILRAANILPDVKNYSEKLLSQVHCEVPLVEEPDDYSSYKDVHFKTVIHYIQCYLDIRLPKFQASRVGQFTPLEHVAKNLTFLTQQANVPREKIITQLKILNASPSNVEAIVNLFGLNPDLKAPQIFQSSVDLMLEDAVSLQKRLQILEKRGISGKEIMEVPQVLKKSEDFVQKVLPSLKSIPELKYGNVLKVLSCKYPQHRVAYMLSSETMKMNNPLAHQIWNQQTLRLKFPQYLAKKFDMSVTAVKDQLSYFPQWYHASPPTVFDTLEYLLGLGYPTDNIRKSIVLLLYKRSVVENALRKYVYTEPMIEKQIQLVNNRHLALCLYHIQRERNFARILAEEAEAEE